MACLPFNTAPRCNSWHNVSQSSARVRLMTARRQVSTTSLSRYARDSAPDPSQRSLDFCNAFWGLGDGGVDVLFARMRGAGRTMEELRGFWRERCVLILDERLWTASTSGSLILHL